MLRFLAFLSLLGLPLVSFAEDRLPTPDYHKQPSDPAWMEQVVQMHGHVGPSVVVGCGWG